MEVIKINYLLWNMNKKNLVSGSVEIVLENSIDVFIALEAENFDVPYFLAKLKKCGRDFYKKEVSPKESGIIFLVRTDIHFSVYKEEKYFRAYKVYGKEKNYFLVVTHLTSPMYSSETARSQRACDLAREIEKLEGSCNADAECEGKQPYHTIVVGDFNLHPFSAGIIGIHGFNAVMDPDKALEESRKLNRKEFKFYYNPMWDLMGKRGKALGTYYRGADQDDNSFYWYTFDQVLIRPGLIDDFIWDEFEIIERIKDDPLLKGTKIHSAKYSDHLPVKFAIQ